ncbi:MAG: hypothetical protein ACM3L9_11360, partial [Deltaproteobacteria bacterium]
MAAWTLSATVEKLHAADSGSRRTIVGAPILTLRILTLAYEPVSARARLVRPLCLAVRTATVPVRMPVAVAVPMVALRTRSRVGGMMAIGGIMPVAADRTPLLRTPFGHGIGVYGYAMRLPRTLGSAIVPETVAPRVVRTRAAPVPAVVVPIPVGMRAAARWRSRAALQRIERPCVPAAAMVTARALRLVAQALPTRSTRRHVGAFCRSLGAALHRRDERRVV